MIVACLFLSFLFLMNKVSQIFNGILMYIFHECFYAGLWDFKVKVLPITRIEMEPRVMPSYMVDPLCWEFRGKGFKQ